MEENNYEEYKKELYQSQKRKFYFNEGKSALIAAIMSFFLWVYLVPFHADNVREICGDELKAYKAYYIENMQILHVGIDDNDDMFYCIGRFYDAEKNVWLISFTPDDDEQLMRQINAVKTYENQLNGCIYIETDLETSGYFYMDEIPSGVSAYYSVFGKKYADLEGANMLELNADYLCKQGENYTLKALKRPGYTLLGTVLIIMGSLKGGILLIRNRPRKSTKPRNNYKI